MNAAANAVTAIFLKKITPKTVCEKVGLDLLSLQRPVEPRTLYDLFGEVNGVSTGSTALGEWIKFRGRFKAVTPDGREFDSGSTHIPGALGDMLHASLNEAKEKDERARIRIALRVGIVPAPTGKPSATGYTYDVQRIIQNAASEDDPIAQLRAEAAKQLALPAPEASAGTAPVMAESAEAATVPAAGPAGGHKRK